MGNAERNAAGALIGPHGFVLCHICMKECDMLSRETAPEYAYCALHRPAPTTKEDPMPTVPKPSQKTKVAKVKPVTRARATTKPKATKASNGVPQALAHLPQRGKMGAFLKELQESQGMTAAELHLACTRHKLSTSGAKHALYLATRLKLVTA